MYFDAGKGQLVRINIVSRQNKIVGILAECFGLKAFEGVLNFRQLAGIANYIDRVEIDR